MTDPIPAGSYIHLRSKEHGLAGNAVVKHCRGAKAGYQIGLAFSGFEWKGSPAPNEQTDPV